MLDVFEKHQLKIARDTLKLSDLGATIMGGMTKDEAAEVVARLGAKEKAGKGKKAKARR